MEQLFDPESPDNGHSEPDAPSSDAPSVFRRRMESLPNSSLITVQDAAARTKIPEGTLSAALSQQRFNGEYAVMNGRKKRCIVVNRHFLDWLDTYTPNRKARKPRTVKAGLRTLAVVIGDLNQALDRANVLADELREKAQDYIELEAALRKVQP